MPTAARTSSWRSSRRSLAVRGRPATPSGPGPGSWPWGARRWPTSSRGSALPQERGRAAKDGVEVVSLSYSYADAAARASAAGVSAARAMAFYFVRDILVGYEAISTFAADSSDFDDTRVSDITRGVTTETQLGDLVGRPSGMYIHPLASAPGERIIVYAYAQKRGAAPLARKQLLVTVDAGGIVRDVQFEKTGEW